MHNVNVNNEHVFEVTSNKSALIVNGKSIAVDMSNINEQSAHVIFEHKSYNTEIVEVDFEQKTCTIKINGNLYNVEVKDQYDALLKQLGLDNLNTNKVLEIKAPMPGLVLNVLVKENDEIKKGDSLLILEAMKMENILKSSSDGIVKEVKVLKGDKVEKNQLLISFK